LRELQGRQRAIEAVGIAEAASARQLRGELEEIRKDHAQVIQRQDIAERKASTMQKVVEQMEIELQTVNAALEASLLREEEASRDAEAAQSAADQLQIQLKTTISEAQLMGQHLLALQADHEEETHTAQRWHPIASPPEPEPQSLQLENNELRVQLDAAMRGMREIEQQYEELRSDARAVRPPPQTALGIGAPEKGGPQHNQLATILLQDVGLGVGDRPGAFSSSPRLPPPKH